MTGKHSDRIRRWLVEQALPLWSTAGVDPEGGFVESLHIDGAPDYAVAKRVRVQARQIYVFSHAAMLGLAPEGVALARRGFDFLIRSAWLGGADGGFACLLDRRGNIIDGRRDAYDNAFVLMSLAWLYRATQDTAVLRAVPQTLAAIDHHLKDPHGEGYLEPTREGLPRWQNPHMHLFEAFLAAYQATRNTVFLDRANAIADLFEHHLFDPGHGVLLEYFTSDWQPAPGEVGTLAEAGHQCEWVWLLNEFGKASATAPSSRIRALYSFAMTHGKDPQSGLLYHESFSDGRVKTRFKRCWAQTEALKAELAIAEHNGARGSERADAVVDNLFSYFLDRSVKGGWNDVVDSENQPIATAIPASTLYHVFLAFSEYLRAHE